MLVRTVAKVMLLLTSALLCAALLEVGLRTVHPKYQSAAESGQERDALRIWSSPRNWRAVFNHPDTGAPHSFIYNDLALRQSREFPTLEGAVNIGVFGDSYTDNVNLPSMHMFTELLDHLLNTTGGRFNVLNFGVNGYGTDQSFLNYLDFDQRDRLDHVISASVRLLF